MPRKHIITIAGKPGSGKSTTSKGVAVGLGFTHYSTGDFFREIGKEMGLDVLATNKAAVSAAEIDYKVDERQKRLGKNEDNFVIDARLGWFFIPESFKVYLDLDLNTAAERILRSIEPERRASEHLPEQAQDYAQLLKERLASESERYRTLYATDPSDLSNYDLVLNTGEISIEEVIKKIVSSYNVWINQQT